MSPGTKDAKKRQRWTPGSLVEISLEEGRTAYAVVLEFPLIAFLNPKKHDRAPAIDIQQSDVLFSLWVMKYAITKGHWRIVDCIAVPDFLKTSPVFFRQKTGSGDFVFHYTDGREEPATYDQVEGLERAAVWDPGHVEQRLNDYVAGRECGIVERFKPKRM